MAPKSPNIKIVKLSNGRFSCEKPTVGAFFSCPKGCGYATKYKSGLLNHWKVRKCQPMITEPPLRAAVPAPQELVNGRYSCPKCGILSKVKEEILDHMSSCNRPYIPPIPKRNSGTKKKKKSRSAQPAKQCQVKTKATNAHFNLSDSNEKIIPREVVSSCLSCPRMSSNEQVMRRHVSKCHPKSKRPGYSKIFMKKQLKVTLKRLDPSQYEPNVKSISSQVVALEKNTLSMEPTERLEGFHQGASELSNDEEYKRNTETTCEEKIDTTICYASTAKRERLLDDCDVLRGATLVLPTVEKSVPLQESVESIEKKENRPLPAVNKPIFESSIPSDVRGEGKDKDGFKTRLITFGCSSDGETTTIHEALKGVSCPLNYVGSSNEPEPTLGTSGDVSNPSNAEESIDSIDNSALCPNATEFHQEEFDGRIDINELIVQGIEDFADGVSREWESTDGQDPQLNGDVIANFDLTLLDSKTNRDLRDDEYLPSDATKNDKSDRCENGGKELAQCQNNRDTESAKDAEILPSPATRNDQSNPCENGNEDLTQFQNYQDMVSAKDGEILHAEATRKDECNLSENGGEKLLPQSQNCQDTKSAKKRLAKVKRQPRRLRKEAESTTTLRRSDRKSQRSLDPDLIRFLLDEKKSESSLECKTSIRIDDENEEVEKEVTSFSKYSCNNCDFVIDAKSVRHCCYYDVFCW